MVEIILAAVVFVIGVAGIAAMIHIVWPDDNVSIKDKSDAGSVPYNEMSLDALRLHRDRLLEEYEHVSDAIGERYAAVLEAAVTGTFSQEQERLDILDNTSHDPS